MQTSSLKLSVIIVNHRSWLALQQLLLSLTVSDCDWFEIIVVDNHSDDDELSAFKARWQQVNWIEATTNAGFAAGCNAGAGQARGRSLLFLNPDMEATPTQLQAIVDIAGAHPEFAILSCRQLNGNGQPNRVLGRFPSVLAQSPAMATVTRFFSNAPDSRAGFTGLRACDWVSGSVVLMTRSTYDRLGGWCEDFWMYSEDIDLCWRARGMGFSVGCSGDVSLTHHHGGASRLDRATEIITRSEVIISRHVYVARHFSPLQRKLAHPIIAASRVVPNLLAAILDLISLFQVQRLGIARTVGWELLRYYASRPWRRNWLSPRAIAGHGTPASARIQHNPTPQG